MGRPASRAPHGESPGGVAPSVSSSFRPLKQYALWHGLNRRATRHGAVRRDNPKMKPQDIVPGAVLNGVPYPSGLGLLAAPLPCM